MASKKMFEIKIFFQDLCCVLFVGCIEIVVEFVFEFPEPDALALPVPQDALFAVEDEFETGELFPELKNHSVNFRN